MQVHLPLYVEHKKSRPHTLPRWSVSFMCRYMLVANINSTASLSSAGTTTEASPPAPPPPEAQPIETKAPEEEMDVTDDDITAGRHIKYNV